MIQKAFANNVSLLTSTVNNVALRHAGFHATCITCYRLISIKCLFTRFRNATMLKLHLLDAASGLITLVQAQTMGL